MGMKERYFVLESRFQLQQLRWSTGDSSREGKTDVRILEMWSPSFYNRFNFTDRFRIPRLYEVSTVKGILEGVAMSFARWTDALKGNGSPKQDPLVALACGSIRSAVCIRKPLCTYMDTYINNTCTCLYCTIVFKYRMFQNYKYTINGYIEIIETNKNVLIIKDLETIKNTYHNPAITHKFYVQKVI
jgi:hypothetical protein